MKGLTLWSGALAFLVIAVVAVSGIYFGFTGKFPFSIAGGMQPLSLSQATFQSSNQFFNQQLWIMTVTQGGLGASAVGTIDNTDVGTKTGKTPASDINIAITYSKQSCEYPIRVSSDENVYSVDRREYTCLWSDDNGANQNCGAGQWYSRGGYDVVGGAFTCFCLRKVPQTGAVAYLTIDNPNVHTVSTIRVTNVSDGAYQEGIFDTQGVDSQPIGSNVYVNWNGDLMRQSCPSQNPYYGFYKNGEWKIGAATNYQNWVAKRNSLSNVIGTTVTKTQLDNLVNGVNSAASSAISSTYVLSGISNNTAMSGAKMIIDLNSAVNNPVFTFYIKAAWIGFLVPQPKPVIASATGVSFKAGAQGDITANVRNDGDTGTVTVTANCNSPLKVSSGYNTQEYTIASGQTQFVRYTINSDTNQPVSGTCTICANPKPFVQSLQSCKDVTVSVTQQIVCDAGKGYCIGNSVYKCNQYGSSNDFVQTCPSGQTCSLSANGVASCQSSGASTCQIDTDCPAGYKCQADVLGRRSCTNVGQPAVCGNNICETGESQTSCPKDCGGGGNYDWLPYLVIVLAIAVAAALILTKKKKRRR